MKPKTLASSTTALLLVVMCVFTVGILNSSVVFAEEETEEEQSTKEALEEKIMLLQEELDRLTERQRGLSDLAERVSLEAELTLKAAIEAELAAETEVIESEDVVEVITVEQRILDLIQEMQSEGALHEGEFYTTSGNWVKMISSKNDKVSTWDPTIWGKVGWNPHKQAWIEGYVGGWVHAGPTYLDPLSSTGTDIQSLYVKQSLKNVEGWHKWNDNSLNPYEIVFKYKEYNKKGDDGCFFYGSAGNSKAGCLDVFDDSGYKSKND
jgi:hypothetical protein